MLKALETWPDAQRDQRSLNPGSHWLHLVSRGIPGFPCRYSNDWAPGIYFSYRTWQWCFCSTFVSLLIFSMNNTPIIPWKWFIPSKAGQKSQPLLFCCRQECSGWASSTTRFHRFALLLCAGMRRQVEFLQYRFLCPYSHSLQGCDGCDQTKDDPGALAAAEVEYEFFFESP